MRKQLFYLISATLCLGVMLSSCSSGEANPVKPEPAYSGVLPVCFKRLNCIKPVFRHRADFVALIPLAFFGIGNDKHLQVRLVEEPSQ